MNEHEQALLEALLEEYAKKGYNPQAVLSNSLFQQLSIEAKISLLRNNLEKLSGKPSFLGALKTSTGVAPGVLAGVGSVLTVKGLAGLAGKPFTAKMGIGAGLLGASTTIIPALLNARSNLKKDEKTRQQLQENKYLQAVIGRSSSGLSKPTANPLLNSLVGKATPRLVA